MQASWRVQGYSLKLVENFLRSRHQRVVLNGNTPNQRKIHTSFPQGSLLFPIYMNDIPSQATSSAKGFANNFWWFSTAHNVNESAASLDKDI